jgi:hypothetical protein
MDRVNCWDPLKPMHHNMDSNVECDGLKSHRMDQWEISSQAAERSVEGSTDRAWSLFEMVKPHECAAPLAGEDVSWTTVKAVEVDLKRSAVTTRAGQLASDQTYVALALRAWLFFEGTNARALYQGVVSQLYFTLTLGDKPQFVAPCWYYPAGGGIHGFPGSAAGPDGLGIFNNGVPTQQALAKLARPIILPVRQNFNVNAEFFSVGTGASVLELLNDDQAGDSKVILFMIDGQPQDTVQAA